MGVLVTGAAGAIGGYLFRRFRDEGIRVDGIDQQAGRQSMVGDVNDVKTMKELLADPALRLVIHCAGKMDVTGERDPLDLITSNILGFTTICSLLRHRSDVRIMYMSSRGVYPWQRSGLVPDQIRETEPVSVNVERSVYDLTKYVVERVAERYRAQFGLSAVGMRLSSTYGLGKAESTHGHQSLLIRLFDAALNGEALEVDGTDQQSDFVYYGDVFSACVKAALATGPLPPVLNISSGARPLREYVDALHRVFPQCKLVSRSGGDYLHTGGFGYVNLDFSLANAVLQYSPTYSIDSAFSEMKRLSEARDGISPWTVKVDCTTLRATYGH